MLIMKRRCLVLLCALTFICIPTVASARFAVAVTSVCALYNSRMSPPSGRMRVKATAWIARRKGAMLVDDTCPKGHVVDFRFAEHLSKTAATREFNRAIQNKPTDFSLRIFEVDVIGRVQKATGSNPKGIFYISEVNSFSRKGVNP